MINKKSVYPIGCGFSLYMGNDKHSITWYIGDHFTVYKPPLFVVLLNLIPYKSGFKMNITVIEKVVRFELANTFSIDLESITNRMVVFGLNWNYLHTGSD